MGRSLLRSEQYVGIEGLALLRLYQADDASMAEDILAELRCLLDSIDDEPSGREVHGARLGVSEGYARWAALYDRPGNPLFDQEGPAVRAMLTGLDRGTVLDAACGTGRHLAWLAAHSDRVIGVDQSPEMLLKASEKVPKADLRVGDLARLPVETGSVDGVVCALALEHLPDLRVAYAEFARVAAPGGWVVVSCLHPLIVQILGWNAWFVDDEGRVDVRTHLHHLSDHINAAVGAGFQVVECVEVPIDQAVVTSSAPAEVAIASPIAHEGLPLVLVLRLHRSAASDGNANRMTS